MNLTANIIIKLFVDAIGQDALKDCYESNWDARKKEIQKLLKGDYDFYVIDDTKFQRVLEIFTEFVDWARKKDYINLSDKIAILDLLVPYMKAIQFTPKDVIPEQDFIEYTIMYSICMAYKHSMVDALNNPDFIKNRSQAILSAISQFNFYLPTEHYTTIVEPLEGVFDMFLAIVKDQKQLFDYWNDKRYEIDDNNSGDLKLLIKRWTKDKSARPTWKVLKYFMNEDLLPSDNFIIEELADVPGKDLYLTFRRRIFSAYFITKLFDSLKEHGLINDTSKEMIQNGIRLFYRHFLVTNEQTLSQEELHNPMFCMLYRFLMKDDMGYDFNTDTAQCFKRILF
ncbi:MAG: hypothetical protein PUC37_00895 [Spirochaetales bacterium]|nr:hypothetical protein [Spirochaetales bacterium]